MDSEDNRNLTTGHVRSEQSDQQRMNPLRALLEHMLDLDFHDRNSATARIDDRPDIITVLIGDLELRVL
jgi:hypothetical protein